MPLGYKAWANSRQDCSSERSLNLDFIHFGRGALSAARTSSNTSARGPVPARVPRECKINVLGRPTRAILELLLMLSQPLWFPCSRFGLKRPTSTRFYVYNEVSSFYGARNAWNMLGYHQRSVLERKSTTATRKPSFTGF